MMPTELLPPPPLSQIRDVALFLDLDGTVAPFAATPAAVGPDPDRNALLSRLGNRLRGRVAIVSGRSIADVDRILSRAVLAVAGVHGLERRLACGSRVVFPAHPKLGTAYVALSQFATANPGLLLENKGHSVALHYRTIPGLEQAVRGMARRLAIETGLSLQEGEMVAELRSPGPDKGDAICAFMSERPFAGAYPLFVGDDLTDEHGFAAVSQIGGAGVLVGPARGTQATWRLDGVPEVLDWLNRGAH
jgi:trehalose 6-phosphate phosphatase